MIETQFILLWVAIYSTIIYYMIKANMLSDESSFNKLGLLILGGKSHGN